MSERIERPDGWPEMYSAAGRAANCPHQMHWYSGDGVYRCIYCDETDDEPPESKVRGGESDGE